MHGYNIEAQLAASTASSVNKHLTTRFVALYLVLGVFAACAVAGAVGFALVIPARAQVKHVQAELGDQNLTRVADKAIAQVAQAQGFAVVSIKIERVVEHGDSATVTARVTVTDGVTNQTVGLKVHLSRGVWTSDGLSPA